MELDNTDVKDYFKRKSTVADWWDPEEKPGLFRDVYVDQRRIIGELLDSKGKTILDAGTGKGRFAIEFATAGASRVYATDLSTEMLEIARARAIKRHAEEKITFQPMDIESLEYPDNFFDAVCCMETFVHLPSPEKAMKELSRVVKQGGLVIGSVTLPTKGWYLNAGRVSNLSQLFEWVFTPFYQSRVYQKGIRRLIGRRPLVGRPLSAEFFSDLFTKSGLTIKKQFYLGHPRAPHFLLVVAVK